MNTRDRRTKQEYALLTIAEWLRDELRFGSVYNTRHADKYTELRDLAFNALGDPTVADADAIKKRYAELDGGEASRCGRCGAVKREGEMRICCM